MNLYTLEKIQKLLPELRQAIYRETIPIPGFKFVEADVPGAQRPELDDADWRDFAVGDRWGGYDKLAWFRATVSFPAHWRGRRVYARFLPGPRDGGDSTAETLLYVDGELLQGIDIWHEDAWLPPEITARGRAHLALKVWSGVLGVPDQRRFRVAELGLIDADAEGLYHLALALHGAVQQLDANDLRRARVLALLDGALRTLDWTAPRSESFYGSVAEAHAALRAGVDALAERRELKPHVVGVGHAHIDMAWLWRLAHSREKAAHTFATALHLQRQYPEYRFMHSSPQLYEYVRRDYPELFAKVKAAIAAGTWEITGGMWVESDINLVAGESLIRQFLHGTRYMRAEFGVESRLLWLPDVFGYSAALPQIARGCGMEYFLTSKLSWSQVNRFPHDTFRWRGIDGTELLTHFITTPEQGSRIYTYNGEFRPADVKGIWDNYRQKDVNDELLMLFGWGDGGGGPTREQLESARALTNLPGLPSVSHGRGEDYFARLAERVAGQELPVWDGELYLEYHRGTYTSQAATKRANRKSELLYHDAEWLCALADVLSGERRYPHAALDEGWKLILLNQFHDILPGSSIRQVYEDSAADYERVRAIGLAALNGAGERLARAVRAPDGGLLALNSLAFARGGLVSLPWSPELDGRSVQLADGTPAPAQAVVEAGERRLLIAVDEVPPLGYRVLPWTSARPRPTPPLAVAPRLLESPFWRIALDERGQIVSLWDKAAGREVIAPGGRANVLQAFTDKPMAFDAWDIDIFYQDQQREVGDLIEAAVEEAGPVRGALRLSWRFHESVITQRLTIYAHDPRIDFRTEVEWRERQVLLKAAFPLNVRTTRATYDIQFGQVERPTHWNTSWDVARFEVPAHKWADLSEGNYGVALLNDCKYGYDARDNVLRLTLIKSPVRPDPEADQGRHVFTYSLLPHQGDWRAGGVLRAGYDLNVPLLASPVAPRPDGPLPPRFALAETDAPSAIVETVKRAEDEPDAWVVRVYESAQFRLPAVRLRFGRPLCRAQAVNMVEREPAELPVDGDTLSFALAPYEVKTFKVWFG
jgi:alpha-mannosidase